MAQCLSASGVRGVEPPRVLEAIEVYFDHRRVPHARRPGGAEPGDVQIYPSSGGWTTIVWPAYFLPRDVEAGLAISRDLQTVISAMSTTETEGWSHSVLACGTLLDKFHSFPAALVWDGDDLAALTSEWSGDPGLVARLFGVEESNIRRHFCQACPDGRDHPGRDPWGFVGLWTSLGITYPHGLLEPYAVLEVDSCWQRLSTVPS